MTRDTGKVRQRIDRCGALLRYFGFAILACGVVLALTGWYLRNVYRPTEATAWQDIKSLHIGFSPWLLASNGHRWATYVYVLTLAISVLVCIGVAICHRGASQRRMIFSAMFLGFSFVPLGSSTWPWTAHETIRAVLFWQSERSHILLGPAGVVLHVTLLLLTWKSWRDDRIPTAAAAAAE
jgi:hypothetical protein